MLTFLSIVFSIDQVLLALLIVCLLVIIRWHKKQPDNFPPGPNGIPFLGTFPLGGKKLPASYKKWSLEKYGAVMSVRVGSHIHVVLNTFGSINEVYVKQGNIASGRMVTSFLKNLMQERGILFRNYSEDYKKQRSFGLKALRSGGFKKSDMEKIICKEASNLIENLKKDCGTSINILPLLNETSASVIGVMVFGSSFHASQGKAKVMLENIKKFLYGEHRRAFFLVLFFPWLTFIPPLSNISKRLRRLFNGVSEIIRTYVDEHKAFFDSNAIHDFIDAYIYEQRFGGNDACGFSDEQLVAYIQDLFTAGTETTATSLYWAIAVLLNFPNYKKVISEEIDNGVGYDEPSLQHRSKLPLTNAFLQEVMRVYPPIHLLFHSSFHEVKAGGYVIPPNTRLGANIWGAHHDPDTWPEPHKFNLYRHINEAGEFVHSPKIIPFSIGPRSCLGESLARNEFFLLFVKIVQNFRIRTIGNTPPPLNESVGFIVQQPKPYQIVLEERWQ